MAPRLLRDESTAQCPVRIGDRDSLHWASRIDVRLRCPNWRPRLIAVTVTHRRPVTLSGLATEIDRLHRDESTSRCAVRVGGRDSSRSPSARHLDGRIPVPSCRGRRIALAEELSGQNALALFVPSSKLTFELSGSRVPRSIDPLGRCGGAWRGYCPAEALTKRLSTPTMC